MMIRSLREQRRQASARTDDRERLVIHYRTALEKIRDLPTVKERWDNERDTLIRGYAWGDDPWSVAVAALEDA